MTMRTNTRAVALRNERVENGPINVLRAAAALAVVLGHARTLFLVDYDDVPQGAIQAALYGASAIGHQAVVVFFVLSGYWVGGSVWTQIKDARFHWPNYLTSRLIRLWVVILPALVLTLASDTVGRHFFGTMSAYSGDPGYGGVVPTTAPPLDAFTFLGNVVFLQAIHVPTLGSNTALWSLSYEFWLYVLAPLVLLVALRRRYFLCVLLLGLGALVGLPVLAYLPLWALGGVVYIKRNDIRRVLGRMGRTRIAFIRIIAALATLAAGVVVRGLNSLPVLLGDYIVAVPASLLLATLVTGFLPGGVGERLLTPYSKLAHSSYSLYAIHVPLLVLAVSALGIQEANRWPSDLLHWTLLLGIVFATVAVAWLFAQGTERHTQVVREFICAPLVSRKPN